MTVCEQALALWLVLHVAWWVWIEVQTELMWRRLQKASR